MLLRMQLRLLAFAQAAERLGFRERLIEYSPEESPRALLARTAPTLDLQTIRVALDCEYCDLDAPIGPAGELALIPPVSGG